MFESKPAIALDSRQTLSQYMVDFWQENVGLPQRFVMCLLQTKDGYLWIGTKGGLARFDGIRFVTYSDRNPDQLKESEVWALAEDKDGSLWIGTYGGGLSRLRNGAFTTLSVQDGLPSDFVTSLQTGRDGSLWVGTEKGLCRLRSGRCTTYTHADGLPSNMVSALHMDGNGVIWIGTQEGLCAFADERIVNYAVIYPSKFAQPIGAIANDAHGGLLVGTDGGAGLYRIEEGIVSPIADATLSAANVTAICGDALGTLWIGTNQGLYRLREGRLERPRFGADDFGANRAPPPDPRAEIETLLFDHEGSLWIGTRFNGLARLRNSIFRNVSGAAAGDPDVGVISVIEDRSGVVWLGTAQGLKRIQDGAATMHPLPSGYPANSLAEDREGGLWIGSGSGGTAMGGLFRMQAGRIARVAAGSLGAYQIRALLTDARGDLWIGTNEHGLYRYRRGRLTHYTSKEGLLGEQVRALALDHRAGLWIGTKDGGLSCLRDGRFTTLGTKDGMASSSVSAIYVDRDDVLWVATRRGLQRIRDQHVATITSQNGLPANFFYQIIEDDHGHLWLTYGRGLARVSKAEMNAVADGKATMVTAVTFGTEDGMNSTAMVVPAQPSAWKSRDGRLWFATDRGAVMFAPSTMSDNPVAPPVWIEEIRIDGKDYDARQPLELPPGRGEVEIHYTALSFVAPEKVKFQYLLKGLDKDWVNVGARRMAYYTNLPPASYRFQVKACNNNGVWNETGTSVTLRLKPHFYQTYWFYALFCALGALLLWAGHRLRVRQVKARFAAVLMERARIARDLHDTLAQSVVGISAQLQAVKKSLVETPVAAGEHLDLAIDMVRHTLVETRRSVWDLRSQVLEGSDLVTALSETVKQLSAATPIQIHVSGSPRPIPKMIENNLLHIGQEALSNAVKHAEAQNIQLEVRYEDSRILLRVQDDGRGFVSEQPFSEPAGHFGLIGMRERIVKLRGRLSVHSLPGQGTEVVAVIPVSGSA